MFALCAEPPGLVSLRTPWRAGASQDPALGDQRGLARTKFSMFHKNWHLLSSDIFICFHNSMEDIKHPTDSQTLLPARAQT